MKSSWILLSLVVLASTSICAKVEWSVNQRIGNNSIQANGWIDGKKFHIQFNASRPAFERSALFYFKRKEQNCPGLAVLFSMVQKDWPIAYVAAACTDDLTDPDMMDELAVDFDREYDMADKDSMLFKGTVEFKEDLEKLAEMSYWNELWIKGLKERGKHSEKFEVRIPIAPTK